MRAMSGQKRPRPGMDTLAVAGERDEELELFDLDAQAQSEAESNSSRRTSRTTRSSKATGSKASGSKADSEKKPKPGRQKKKQQPTDAQRTKKRRCFACKKYFDSTGMALNQHFCHKDKLALDNLYHIAVRQGRLSWFNEAKKDEENVEAMLENYFLKCPPPPPGHKRKKGEGAKFDLAVYIEELNSKSRTKVRRTGKMMWLEEYIEFTATTAGGNKKRSEAEAAWAQWLVPDSGEICDTGGPGPEDKHRHRVWVELGKFVDFENEFERVKPLACPTKFLQQVFGCGVGRRAEKQK